MPFELKYFEDEEKLQLIDREVDEHGWSTILPDTYWGGVDINFALKGQFDIPINGKLIEIQVQPLEIVTLRLITG